MIIDGKIIFDVSNYQWNEFLIDNLDYLKFKKNQDFNIRGLSTAQFKEFIHFIYQVLKENFKKKQLDCFLVYHKKFFKVHLEIKSDFFCVVDFSGTIEVIRKKQKTYQELLNCLAILSEKEHFEQILVLECEAGGVRKTKL